MSKFDIIRSATLYKGHCYDDLIKEWKLEEELNLNDEHYNKKAIKCLTSLILEYFEGDIRYIEFPKPLPGDFLYAMIQTVEDEEIFQISLGV